MEGHHHYHQHPQLQQQHISVNVEASDRFPQWNVQETKEFLLIRAELDQTFMETKRNKLLWEVTSNRMREKGYNRSPEQCKCKWKNLVTRYKGCVTVEPESMRQQFPFYNELQGIFAARMQRMLWSEAEGAAATSGSKKKAVQLSSDDEDDNEESEGERGNTRKKKKGKTTASGSSSSNITSNSLREILEDFMKQQMQLEMQWREAFEARENERRIKEAEWRLAMEALENERLMMDRRWREREEQRQIREAFWLMYKAFKDLGQPDSAYPAPYAIVFRNMAILAVEGFSSLPKNCLLLCYIFFGAAILINLIRDSLHTNYSRFIPIPMAMAIPFYIGPYFAIDMCVGSLILFIWEKINKAKADAFGPAVASGLICGDGIWTLPSSILALAGVHPPICMKFLSRATNTRVDNFLSGS